MDDRLDQQPGNDRFVYLLAPGDGIPARHNLPAQLTLLIGREQAVEVVYALLQRADVRLVTLTGTGGIGKTRLSLQVASESLEAFADGVYFVPLASISYPALVLATIASALGVKLANRGLRAPASFMELVKLFLRDKHFLLVLDNFEQVVKAAPDLTELLGACPHLKILVTSRAVLHVHGEHEFAVPPLALPERGRIDLLESAVLSQYAAIALFLQRALAIRPDLALTQTNIQAIADICLNLDGLPLAIELAAARVKLLSPQALLQRLTHRLQILTGNRQDAPARHQTLRDTIGWSYNLLEPEEQQLFRQISIFVGGATLEAIESICNTFAEQKEQVLDLIALLMDKSLLQQVEQEGSEARIVMLETIRDYALECLQASGEEEQVRQSHAAYYLNLAEESARELGGPEQAIWLGLLEREHDNLRAVLAWSLQQGVDEDATTRRREMGLHMGGALRRFWQMHGHLHEGQQFLEQILSASKGVVVSTRAQARALLAAGTLAATQNDFDRVETSCRQSLALFRELEDQSGIALSLYLLSVVPWMKSDNLAARALTEEALALFRKMGEKERIAWSLSTLGLLDTQEGEYAHAYTLYEESLAIHRGSGDKRGIATILLHLAQLLFVSQGDQAALRSLLEESLTLFIELGEKEGIANSYTLSGQLALSQGGAVSARLWLEKSIKLYNEMGHQKARAEALALLARVSMAQEEGTAARAMYEESLAIAREINHLWLIASCLEGWAATVAEPDQSAWAARLWGAAEALRETIRVPIPLVERAGYERLVAAARVQMGEEAFSAAWTQGRAMTPEQALAADTQKIVSLPTTAITPPPPSHSAGLTARELEVLRLVARGLTNAQIARTLVLSEKTVATHLTHIFNKTNSENRAAAVAFAIRHSLA